MNLRGPYSTQEESIGPNPPMFASCKKLEKLSRDLYRILQRHSEPIRDYRNDSTSIPFCNFCTRHNKESYTLHSLFCFFTLAEFILT